MPNKKVALVDVDGCLVLEGGVINQKLIAKLKAQNYDEVILFTQRSIFMRHTQIGSSVFAENGKSPIDTPTPVVIQALEKVGLKNITVSTSVDKYFGKPTSYYTKQDGLAAFEKLAPHYLANFMEEPDATQREAQRLLNHEVTQVRLSLKTDQLQPTLFYPTKKDEQYVHLLSQKILLDMDLEWQDDLEIDYYDDHPANLREVGLCHLHSNIKLNLFQVSKEVPCGTELTAKNDEKSRSRARTLSNAMDSRSQLDVTLQQIQKNAAAQQELLDQLLVKLEAEGTAFIKYFSKSLTQATFNEKKAVAEKFKTEYLKMIEAIAAKAQEIPYVLFHINTKAKSLEFTPGSRALIKKINNLEARIQPVLHSHALSKEFVTGIHTLSKVLVCGGPLPTFEEVVNNFKKEYRLIMQKSSQAGQTAEVQLLLKIRDAIEQVQDKMRAYPLQNPPLHEILPVIYKLRAEYMDAVAKSRKPQTSVNVAVDNLLYGLFQAQKRFGPDDEHLRNHFIAHLPSSSRASIVSSEDVKGVIVLDLRGSVSSSMHERQSSAADDKSSKMGGTPPMASTLAKSMATSQVISQQPTTERSSSVSVSSATEESLIMLQ